MKMRGEGIAGGELEPDRVVALAPRISVDDGELHPRFEAGNLEWLEGHPRRRIHCHLVAAGLQDDQSNWLRRLHRKIAVEDVVHDLPLRSHLAELRDVLAAVG